MAKFYLSLLFTTSCFAFYLSAQCPEGNVFLKNQAEIDQFVLDYPDCTALEGNLLIGNLNVTNIEDISGLAGLTSVGGNLSIFENFNLSSLAGLDDLISVGGYLRLEDNVSLGSLENLSNLRSIGDYLEIDGNLELTDLSGLEHILSVEAELQIRDNSSLASLSGLHRLTSVAGGITIINNDALTDLDDLVNLNSMNGDLRIEENLVLTNLSGLAGITSVGGEVVIRENNALVDITGLENIDAYSMTVLAIQSNPQLSHCAMENFCNFTLVESNWAIISGNNTGCSDRTAVAYSCWPGCPFGDISLFNQAQVDQFVSDYADCSAITGRLWIGRGFSSPPSEITDLSGLANLRGVGGNLELSANGLLTDLTGLEGITIIGGGLSIVRNDSLVSIASLGNLTKVGDGFYVAENPALRSLEGLDNVTSIGGDFALYDNPKISDLAALSKVTAIDGFVEIINNDSLRNLDGLSQLRTIDEYIHIQRNDVLTNLSGIANIDPFSFRELNLRGNPELTYCAVESICEFIERFSVIVSISFSNGGGCSSQQEVEMRCSYQLDGDLCYGAIDIDTLLGRGLELPQTSQLYNNMDYAAADSPEEGFACHKEGDAVTSSLWLRFTGDGEAYRFRTVSCSASDYLADTQMALYSGDCDNLSPVACGEDEDLSQGFLNAAIDNFTTEAGTEYYLLVDGYDGVEGDFCLEVTQLTTVSTTYTEFKDIRLFPNPTSGRLQLENISPERVLVFNSQGQVVATYNKPNSEIDLSSLPAGIYYLQLLTPNTIYSARVAKTD